MRTVKYDILFLYVKMKKYYDEWAKTYDDIYYQQDKIRVKEQELLITYMCNYLDGRNIIDLGAGTGYWGVRISSKINSLLNIDISKEMMDSSLNKQYFCKTHHLINDMYNLSIKTSYYNGIICNFIVSHLMKEKIGLFIDVVNGILKKNTRIIP